MARFVSTLSGVVATHPEIAELEVNPALATPDAAVGLDGRVVLAALTRRRS